MAAKRFGAVDLSVANMDTVLMDSGSSVDSTVNVRFVNRNASTVKVRLAIVDAPSGTAVANLSDEDYLEYDTEILANEVLENTGIVVPASYSLVIRSDTTDVNAIAYGFEQEVV